MLLEPVPAVTPPNSRLRFCHRRLERLDERRDVNDVLFDEGLGIERGHRRDRIFDPDDLMRVRRSIIDEKERERVLERLRTERTATGTLDVSSECVELWACDGPCTQARTLARTLTSLQHVRARQTASAPLRTTSLASGSFRTGYRHLAASVCMKAT